MQCFEDECLISKFGFVPLLPGREEKCPFPLFCPYLGATFGEKAFLFII